MSCRVLGRQVEQAVLQEILRHAREHGLSRLVGKYIPTAKNDLVKAHYQKLGFRLVSDEQGTTVWELDVDSTPVVQVPMTVSRPSAELAASA
jgi:predicted enzyme involved in methoxymalonyl-ACP biosynthesis